MTAAGNTRNSLILRLRDRADAEAWREFVSIYQPAIYRVAKRRGLQDADAGELVQRVLLAVVRAVDRFQPDPERAKFRTWLFRICENEICKQLAVSQKLRGSGDSGVQAVLNAHPSQNPEDSLFRMEYRRAVFRWAAERVEPSVEPRTWRAFWLTAVEQVTPAQVATRLSMSVGAVYIARSRVMARLQLAVREFEEQPDAV